MAAGSDAKTRLETWKEVAGFLRKDERTVKRWEAERGLPIHRLPGESRSRIFALVAELEAWRASGGAPVTAATAQSSDPAGPTDGASGTMGRRRFAGVLALTGAAIALALIVFIGDSTLRHRRPPSLAAQRYYVAASDHWAERTPESLNTAIGEYNAAIARDPDYAEAYAGLACDYDLLREYTQMPASQAYPLARRAARRALALNDNVSSAHAALGFAEYWGYWNAAAAVREFKRALALDPRSAMAEHWYATTLSAEGDQQAALAHIDAALAIDPDSLAAAADRGLILFLAGRDGDGLAVLRAIESAHPEFLSAHAYLADYDFDRGDFRDYLSEAKRVGELTGDDGALKNVAIEAEGLSAGGRPGFLRALTGQQLKRFRDGQLSAYSMAEVYAASGDANNALALLRLSRDRHEPDLMGARGDESLRLLRPSREFADILASVGPLDTGWLPFQRPS